MLEQPLTRKSIIVNRIWKRIHEQNKNALVIVCSGTGEGKSSVSLSLAEAIDPTFNEDRIVWNEKTLIQKVQDEAKWQHGQAIVFEEIGTKLDSREWYSITNQAILHFLQTFRHKKALLICNVPSLGYIDKKSHLLFNYCFQPIYIDYDLNYVVTKPFQVSFDPLNRKKDPYFQYPRTRFQGSVKVIRHACFSLPSPELWKKYDVLQHEEKNKIATECLRKIALAEAKEQHEEGKYLREQYEAEAVDDILKHPEKFLIKTGGRKGEVSAQLLSAYHPNVAITKSQIVAKRAKIELDKRKNIEEALKGASSDTN